jgi:hypothetical protein
LKGRLKIRDVWKRVVSSILVAVMVTAFAASSAQARFLTPDTYDPWMQGVDINRYSYAGDDPVNGSDPNGHNNMGDNGGPPLDPIDVEDEPEFTTDMPGMDRIERQFERMVRNLVDGAAGTAIIAVDKRNRDIKAADIKREAQRAQIATNAKDGAQRERDFVKELQAKYPSASIQSQTYLRDKDGKIVRDPVTGEARRVDVVVVRGRQGIAFEVTSRTADKTRQSEKDARIRSSGGNYFRDRTSGNMMKLDRTRIERRR